MFCCSKCVLVLWIEGSISCRSLCGGAIKFNGISSTKLVDAGFRFEYGLEEMYDGAIECCKERGLL